MKISSTLFEHMKKMEAIESDMVASSPDEFRKRLITETERWKNLIPRLGIEKPND